MITGSYVQLHQIPPEIPLFEPGSRVAAATPYFKVQYNKEHLLALISDLPSARMQLLALYSLCTQF
jgi:hypothetical protein